MRKQKNNAKGAKTIEALGIQAINEECKTCIYYNKKICKGQFNRIIPCLYAKTKEEDIS